MYRSATLKRLKSSLKAGRVYRRSELTRLSSNLDRHLSILVKDGHLKKLQQGLYVCPETTVFGVPPPDESTLLKSFLKDDHFVVYSPNAFNGLGLGTTQLYNQRVVFNRKRIGEHKLGNRTYHFRRWREAPRVVTREFLLVELMNRLSNLAEERENVLNRLKQKLSEFDSKKLKFAVKRYGTYSTQLKLNSLLDRTHSDSGRSSG